MFNIYVLDNEKLVIEKPDCSMVNNNEPTLSHRN